jgi:PIN domain nuclease of toxin-antitoxin system
MIEYILDSTALIALVGLESGSQRIAQLLRNSAVSTVNLAETANKLLEKGFTEVEVRTSLAKLELKVENWTEDLAYRSAEFTQFNKSHGLSLGDRACLTLAKHLRATAVTSDRAWRRVPTLGVRIMMFR